MLRFEFVIPFGIRCCRLELDHLVFEQVDSPVGEMSDGRGGAA